MAIDSDTNSLTGHVIVCGLGHVGYRIVSLLTQLGQRGIIITREIRAEWCMTTEPHFPVIIGDARNEKLLHQAGIERAKAILVVTDDDLANVSIALDARRLNPDITIICRLFDQQLAGHLEKSVKINRAFSASALAVPAFMAAALGSTVRGSFEVDSSFCIIEELAVESDSEAAGKSLEQWAAETGQAVVALHRGKELLMKPTIDTIILPGDNLTCLCLTKNGKQAVAVSRASNPKKFLKLFSPGGWISGVREWWHDIPHALRTALIILLIFVVISVGVFRVALDISLIDSLYFVITTITTVGYGDLNLLNASAFMKIYGAFMMLCGAAIIAMLFSIINDLMLKSRLRNIFSRNCAHFKDHIIVTGIGSIGVRLVKHLARNGEKVVAIDRRNDLELLHAAKELRYLVQGDAKDDEVLRKAGIRGAKSLVAVTDNDLVNLSIGLATKRAGNSCRVVLRLFDSMLAEKMQDGMDIDSVLSVSAAAAPTFVGSVLCPDMLQGFILQNSLVLIFRRQIRANTPTNGKSAVDIGGNESILYIKSAGKISFDSAPPNCTLREGDEFIGARWYGFIPG